MVCEIFTEFADGSGRVQESEDFYPVAMSLDWKTLAVVSIEKRLEEEGASWDPEQVWNIHYEVTLEDGRDVAIFRNMKTGGRYGAV
jgi:hypothetical protein